VEPSGTEDEAKAPAERGTPPRDDGPRNSSARAGSTLLPDLRVDEKQHGDPCEGPEDIHQPDEEEGGARHPRQHQEASGGGDSRSEEEGEES